MSSCVFSAIVFFFVKSDVQRVRTAEETPLLIDNVGSLKELGALALIYVKLLDLHFI